MALLAATQVPSPSGISRERILYYLWPESDEEHGRNSLRQILHALRRDLREPALFLGGPELRLNPLAATSDVAEFLAALARNELPAAAAVYAGPFLDGFHLSEVPDFSRWIDDTRRQLDIQARETFQTLARTAQRAGDYDEAQHRWRQAAMIDPLDPHIAAGLMESLNGAGDRAGALNYFRAYETLMREELEAAPDEAVSTLAERLRSRPRPSPGPSAAMPVMSPPTDSPSLPPAMSSTAPGLSVPATAPGSAGFRRRLMLTLAVTAAVIVGVWLVRTPRTDTTRLDPVLLAVAPFKVFDPGLEIWREGLVDILSRNIDGLGRLRTVAPSVVIRHWGGTPDPSSAAGLGRATGAGLVLFGTLVRAGIDSVRLTATLVEVKSGRVLADLDRRDASGRMDRLTDSVSVAVLRELGERGDVAGIRPALRWSSIEALKLFLRGEQFFRRTEWDSARAYYEKAMGRDNGLALVYRRLGTVLEWQRVSDDSLAGAYMLRAGELNHGLTPRDSVLVRSDSLGAALSATDDPGTTWQLRQSLLSTVRHAVLRYPDDPEAWIALGEAGYHFGTGPRSSMSEAEILGAFDHAIALDSGFALAYLHTIELALATGGRDPARRYLHAYLALEHGTELHRSAGLMRELLDPSPAAASAAATILDTASANVLTSARTITRHWLDSAETTVRLSRLLVQGRRSSYPLFTDSTTLQQRLAQVLALRGHLAEAERTIARHEVQLRVELAMLGATTADSADAVFRRWLRQRSDVRRFTTAWWSQRRDTVALRTLLADARRRIGRDTSTSAVRAARYDSSAAEAHLALARGDSSRARVMFAALPDSDCTRCYMDRLILARLSGWAGRWGDAKVVLNERPMPFAGAAEVLFALERARVAAHLGDLEERRRQYAFVAGAWLRGDSGLQGMVEEARQGAR